MTVFVCPQNPVFADIMDGLVTSGKVFYSPQTGKWSSSSSDTAITLTRKITAGKSVYRLENGNVAFTTNADFEFIYGDKLLFYYCDNLRFNEITYTGNNTFEEKMVSIGDLEKLFPNTYIVPVSKFQNDMTIVLRTPFAREKALLVNDTNRTFKDYVFSPYPVQKSPIKGLFAVTKVGMIKYMKKDDFQQKYPVLKIKLRNDPDKYYKGPNIYMKTYSY